MEISEQASSAELVVLKVETQSKDFSSNSWAVASKAEQASVPADVAENVVVRADAPNVRLSEQAEFWDDKHTPPYS